MSSSEDAALRKTVLPPLRAGGAFFFCPCFSASAVLIDGGDLRPLAHAGDLHLVPCLDGAAGGGDGLPALLPDAHGGLGLVETAAEVGLLLVVIDGGQGRRLAAAHFLQLGEDGVRLLAGVLQDAAGLSLAPAAGVLLGLFHLLPELPGTSGVLLPADGQAVQLLLLLFQGLALGLQLGDDILQAVALAVHLALGVGDDVLAEAQALGDGEGVGLPRDADEQAVGGPQSLHIELAGGVLHPRRGHGKGLELGVVGGRGHAGAGLAHPLKRR